MNRQRISIYDIEWQCLRINLQGKWHNMEGVAKNLAQLMAYLGKEQDVETHEYGTRLYRMVNLLDAVKMGHNGLGFAGTEEGLLVRTFSKTLSAWYMDFRIRLEGPLNFVAPTAAEIHDDCLLIGMQRTNNILQDLYARRSLATYKVKHKAKVEIDTVQAREILKENRPELFWAIDVMEKAIIYMGDHNGI